ncbi:membrane protein [Gluconacetobacter liquefaciens]|uniref:PepSY domain-containing protein n=1 Tax=Gluconacetobacter liquefaciens TaxID=89584 RepID=A0A370G3K5_GLULI|nr:PepSY-associated TM helix domain-containing protein [Gluconacetobacter liquefaciens]MBB2186804.1 PepSY domain-containing protein [Gluconacetobacter liquefaciens]RDI37780.1 putative iron-regulated membrane protein [Gluconacetobacter liquefaciens]GBQ92531.1 hypothetical protein AA0522_0067 [Gluconacetobacter liquefaciens NRIC 0522]GEB38925.1 membrane protein [Gluconacetobacter liquefaciens]
MKAHTLRCWFLVHKWTSLVSTLFLLLICVTGLPLIFREEISDWLDTSQPYAQVAPGTPTQPVETVLDSARRHNPDQVVVSAFVDDDAPRIVIGMAPSWPAYNQDPRIAHFLKFDAHTGMLLRDSTAFSGARSGFLPLMLHVHTDLFTGLPGNLFMGLMSLFLAAAILSGIVLYRPFMKRLPFGTLRRDRGTRMAWLDLHNLLGIVLAAWMGVVGLTGTLNELSTPLFAVWQASDVQAMLRTWRGRPPIAAADRTSLDAAFRAAQAALPDRRVISAIFPGSRMGTPYHYVIWTKGNTPLTARLFTPLLVDARTGRVTAIVPMPWYLRALEISRPLHFGDYGAMPLKIIWAMLDLGTIMVLVSGLILWVGKHRLPAQPRLRALGRAPDDETTTATG